MRPSEFSLPLRRGGLATTRLAGMSYDWRGGEWRISDDLSVNYLLVAVRRHCSASGCRSERCEAIPTNFR